MKKNLDCIPVAQCVAHVAQAVAQMLLFVAPNAKPEILLLSKSLCGTGN